MTSIISTRILRLVWLILLAYCSNTSLHALDRALPDPLRSWQDWATWDDTERLAPAPFNNYDQKLASWPSELAVNVGKTGGTFTLRVVVYAETWLYLPGNREVWPLNVKAGGTSLPVTEENDKPRVRLQAGTWDVGRISLGGDAAKSSDTSKHRPAFPHARWSED